MVLNHDNWIKRLLGFCLLFSVSCSEMSKDVEEEEKEDKKEEEEDEEEEELDFSVQVIPSGSFEMGCTEGDSECFDDEYPVHTVEITRSFALMTTEVTQEVYEAVMGENPSYFAESGDFPVEQVSWFDAVQFANELSRLEGREECYSILEGDSGIAVDWIGFDCNGWRLPTEAEWEFAARGNEDLIYAGSNNFDEVGWHWGNTGDQAQRVAQLEPNGFGLYDMSGNVWEWCWDWYGDYSTENQSDPTGALIGSNRLARGGSWGNEEWAMRISLRSGDAPSVGSNLLGFRLGRSL